MKNEHKLAYWDLLARHLDAWSQPVTAWEPPSLGWAMAHWGECLQRLRTQRDAEARRRASCALLAELAKAARHDFEGFDEAAFWGAPEAQGHRYHFELFVARAERRTETGSWHPKSCAAIGEVQQWLERALGSLTLLELVRVEEAIAQLPDFPVDDACTDAALRLLEQQLEPLRFDCGWPAMYALLEALAAPRFQEAVTRRHQRAPSFVTQELLYRYKSPPR